ncbi:MAG: thermonuclease family protein [Pseudaminobacter sp.]|nr:thermonuclease family protein [Pseudaminobacter sp.]
MAEARATKSFRGPVEATVLQVIDGDTFLAEAHVWPGHSVRVNIRIRGIDAPEMKSRCEAERAAALHARAVLSELVGQGVSISNIGGAKYYGRVLADVATATGDTVSAIMLDRKIVRPYGGGKRLGWCG